MYTSSNLRRLCKRNKIRKCVEVVVMIPTLFWTNKTIFKALSINLKLLKKRPENVLETFEKAVKKAVKNTYIIIKFVMKVKLLLGYTKKIFNTRIY